MLEKLLSAVPDTLTVDEVAELIGCHRRTILRYVQRKCIYAVTIMGKYYISKKSLISYLATDKAFKNTQKSEWHKYIISLKIKIKLLFPNLICRRGNKLIISPVTIIQNRIYAIVQKNVFTLIHFPKSIPILFGVIILQFIN